MNDSAPRGTYNNGVYMRAYQDHFSKQSNCSHNVSPLFARSNYREESVAGKLRVTWQDSNPHSHHHLSVFRVLYESFELFFHFYFYKCSKFLFLKLENFLEFFWNFLVFLIFFVLLNIFSKLFSQVIYKIKRKLNSKLEWQNSKQPTSK